MKSITIFLFVIISISSMLHGQAFWLFPEVVDDEFIVLADNHGNEYLRQKVYKNLNYNPVFNLSNETINLDLTNNPLNRSTIFTVFEKSYISEEEHIWNISSQNTDNIILTNERLADRKKGSFINFMQKNNAAQLNVYQQLIQEFTSTKFQIGGNANNTSIPINAFTGELGEIVIFDKYLAPLSKQILESNLAIKYGIPLQSGVDYYGSEGKILWSYDEHKAFCNNISGIGKNVSLKLNQKQSKSKLNDGYFALGLINIEEFNYLNKATWDDESYLMWGDNNMDVSFSRKNNGIQFLERAWKFNGKGFDESQILQLLIQEENTIREKPKYNDIWVLWNNSADPVFNLNKNIIQKAKINKDLIVFNSLKFDKQNPYLHVFNAPDFWVAINIDNPSCAINKSGTIQGKVLGPEPPYLININSSINSISISIDTREFTIPSLESNSYSFEIIAENGESWITDIVISDESFLSIPLLPLYNLNESESIVIDASSNVTEEAKFLWTLPNGEHHYSPELSLKESGVYSLLITADNCSSFYKTEVINSSNNIKECTVFPNPTTTGKYILKARLNNPAAYSIQISTIQGEFISTQHFPPSKNIEYYGNLSHDGMYLVSLISGESRYNSKLIVLQD